MIFLLPENIILPVSAYVMLSISSGWFLSQDMGS